MRSACMFGVDIGFIVHAVAVTVVVVVEIGSFVRAGNHS